MVENQKLPHIVAEAVRRGDLGQAAVLWLLIRYPAKNLESLSAVQITQAQEELRKECNK